MKCKKCRKDIPDGSFYCNICGAKQFRDDEVSVPKPRRKKDGTYSGQVYRNGNRITITGSSLAEYRQNAREFKMSDGELPDTGYLDKPMIFGELFSDYITARKEELSPATVKNLMSISRSRFRDAFDIDIRLIDFQKLIDHEATLISAKSLSSIWQVVKPMFAYYGLPTPEVKLPKIKLKEQDFLDSEQIPVLLNGIRGDPDELAIILALHSLRISEICALDVSDIYDGKIHVHASMIEVDGGGCVFREGNKTQASTRTIPVLIDRLYELMPESGLVCKRGRNNLSKRIATICKNLGLPACSCHDLRRSFCSLCYEKGIREEYLMAYGGWTNYATVHKYYIRISEQSKLKNAEILRDYFNIAKEPQEAP